MYQDMDLKGLRVAKYIRCSTEQQVELGETLEAQSEILDEFISKNNMVLVDTFVDEGLTGRKKLEKRKEFNRLLTGVKARAFDLIIFTKLERWFRNVRDYQNTQAILDEYGVSWKAVTENYDTTTSNGRLYVNIRMAVAQDECDRISERVKDVFHYKLQNKTFISGSLPRGLKLDSEKRVIADPEWEQYVHDMFDYYEMTSSKRQTRFYLQDKYNVPVSHLSLSRALANTLFIGEYQGIKDFCPAMITKEQFARVQKFAKRGVRNKKTRHYYFTGLLICKSCGHRMTAQSRIQKRKNGSTYEYRTYRCDQHHTYHRCSRGKLLNEKFLENYMLSHVLEQLTAYVDLLEVGESQKQVQPVSYEKKIKKKMKKLYDLFMDDLIDKDLYSKEYAALKEELAAAKKEYEESVTLQDPEKTKNILSNGWQDVYESLNDMEKGGFWRSFIDKIIVDENNNIQIYFL